MTAFEPGFHANPSVRPVVQVDFNEQADGGVMIAHLNSWVVKPGQPVILREPHGNGEGVHLDCDGAVIETNLRNFKGEPWPGVARVRIADEPRFRDGK